MNSNLHKRLIIIVYLLTIITINKAQTFSWAESSVGTGTVSDIGLSSCTDANGNVFIAGYFTSSSISFGTYTLTNVGGEDIFLAKYDPTGNVIWAKTAGNTGKDIASNITVDALGNVLMTGEFGGPSITFGTFTLSNSGGQDIFITKYDNNGNVTWAKNAGMAGSDVGYSISTDAGGNILISGAFNSSSLSFGTYTLTNAGSKDVFIAKFDVNGNVLWAKGAGGVNDDIGNSVSNDASGNTFVTGYFDSPSITFGTTTYTNSGIFLTKYDNNGNVVWTKTQNGSGNNSGTCVSVDPFGNPFITGFFQGSSFSIGSYTLTSLVNFTAFLAKFDNNGNVQWAKNPKGSNLSLGWSVSTYTNGVFFSGSYCCASIAFGTNTLTSPSGSPDPMYIVEYDLNGNFVCGTPLASGGQNTNAIHADNSGSAYLTSGFIKTPFVVGTTTLTLNGTKNVFLAKYGCSLAGIDEIENTLDVKIFPNPNNGFFKIQIDNQIENGEIVLVNVLGQKIHEQKIFRGENYIQTKNISQGIYHYVVLQNKKGTAMGNVIIE